jgi:hypothetical protein
MATVRASDLGRIQNSLEDIKGVRWMPRHGMPMKDVAACDKPRRGGKQPLTRGSPNEETQSDGRSDYLVLNI